MRCTETPGCSGSYDPDGYCDQCGVKQPAATTMLPVPPDAGPSVLSGVSGTSRTSATSGTSVTSGPRGAFGGGLVALPPILSPDPMAAVLTDPQVAEAQRFCSNPDCGAPVGRAKDTAPGRTEGFCPRCSTPFSFVPRLRAGDLVEHYEIAGCLAHGGLGWVYLARDRNVDDLWRVLKGVLHHGDPQAMANAIEERRFLAAVKHPNIVNIINFVEHDGAGYIVMEHVDGVSLRQLRRTGVLPVTHAISYILEILPALDYLHKHGLIYSDFKPENVMCSGTSVKLIDLGGVYRIGDESNPVYFTPGYAAPEIGDTKPTVSSDLFTVGRTLAVLCTSSFPGFQSTFRYALPPPEMVPGLAVHDPLYQLLRRATATDPTARFASAAEMADQLSGVLREIVASETGHPQPATSAHFTGKVRGRLDRPDRHALPVPLVNLDDPAAAYLTTVVALDPTTLVDALRAAPEQTVEVELQLVRALLDASRADEAATVLRDLEATNAHDWRTHWYAALHHLAVGAPEPAYDEFDTVYRYLPGELAPKLAMGMALEQKGDAGCAAFWYDIVSRTDASFTAASFGLARCRLAIGDASGAVNAYERVPDSSRAYTDAQVAMARVRLGARADLTSVVEAGRIIEALSLEGAQAATLGVEVLGATLPLVTGVHDAPAGAGTVMGCALTETEVRVGLERAYRTLARHTATAEQRIRLVDRANRVRPRTLT